MTDIREYPLPATVSAAPAKAAARPVRVVGPDGIRAWPAQFVGWQFKSIATF